MKSSYKKFINEVSLANFDTVNDKLRQIKIKPLKIQNFQLEDQSQIAKQSRTSPYLNENKQPYDNQQNLYLRIISLIKQFIRCPNLSISFLEYAHHNSNLQHLLNKLQNLRLHNIEIQLIFYLLKANNKKLFSLYNRLREEILKRCGLNKAKFSPISIHNPHKHFLKEQIKLSGIQIDYEYWGMLVENIAKVQVEQDMLWWASSGNRQLSAQQFVRICLWKSAQQIKLD